MNISRSSLQDHHRHYRHPSFSSTLLEDIYRSFDEERETTPHLTSTTHHINHGLNKINTSSSTSYFGSDDHFAVDRWMANEKIKVRRASLPEGILRRPNNYSSSSTSTSADSCSSGVCGSFSSSDTDYSLYRSSRQKHLPPLKPIRVAESSRERYSDEIPPAKKKKEGNLQQRALKLYGDLKKVRQPISPGGKLAAFLHSLFNSNALKKPKISSSSPSYNGLNLDRESASAPSTASRSCLSKTPSSAGRFEKRSVRFEDEERGRMIRNGARAGLAKRDSSSIRASDEDLKHHMRERQRRVEEVAKELLKNYHHHHRKESTVDIVSVHHHDIRKFRFRGNERESEDEEDEDDDASCCSSDLFELENWLEIGADHRYREELPVYETTRFDPNRVIAI